MGAEVNSRRAVSSTASMLRFFCALAAALEATAAAQGQRQKAQRVREQLAGGEGPRRAAGRAGGAPRAGGGGGTLAGRRATPFVSERRAAPFVPGRRWRTGQATKKEKMEGGQWHTGRVNSRREVAAG